MALTYLACILVSLILIFPTLWMLSTSLKDVAQVYRLPVAWLPQPPTRRHCGSTRSTMPFGNYVRNSLFIVVGSTFGTMLSSSLVAYGFARFRAPGKNALFVLVLATMMLPYAVTMSPQFVMFSKLGWVNNFNPLIIPAFFGSPFFIFLLRQFYMTIPRDLDEAAKMDGASALWIWFTIILPLSKPALVTVAVFSAIWTWNDYLGPLIYLSGKDNFTVAVGLAFFQGEHSTDWGMLMAASTMAVVPSLIIFLLAQKYFVQGIATSGLKG